MHVSSFPVAAPDAMRDQDALALLEKSIGELNKLKSEVADGIFEQRRNNKETMSTVGKLTDEFFKGANLATKKQEEAYEKLGTSLTKIDGPLAHVATALMYDAIGASHVDKAARNTNDSVKKAMEGIHFENLRQTLLVDNLLAPLTLQTARNTEFLKNVVVTATDWCTDFNTLDDKGQSESEWRAFFARVAKLPDIMQSTVSIACIRAKIVCSAGASYFGNTKNASGCNVKN